MYEDGEGRRVSQGPVILVGILVAHYLFSTSRGLQAIPSSLLRA